MSDRAYYLLSGAAIIVALLCIVFGTYEAMEVLAYDWQAPNA